MTIEYNQPIDEVLAEIGQPPLPPYLKAPAEEIDKTRYQTCYAKYASAAAAPTAGLHFTDEMLAIFRNQGVNIAKITLHVGAGTFELLRPEQLASG